MVSEQDGTLLWRRLALLEKAFTGMSSIAAENDPRVRARRLIKLIQEVTGARCAGLGMLEPDGRLKELFAVGLDTATRKRLTQDVSFWVTLSKGKMDTQDLISLNRLNFAPHFISFLGLPVMVEDRALGVLFVADKDKALDFTDEDRWILGIMSFHTAIALRDIHLAEENSRVKVQAQMRLRELEANIRILEAITNTSDLETLLRRVLDETMTLLDMDAGGVYLTEGDRLVLKVWRGLPESVRAYIQVLSPDEMLASSDEVSIIEEPLDEAGVLPSFVKREGFQTWIQIPLGIQGRLLGAIVLSSHRCGFVGGEVCRALQAMAIQVALAVEYARHKEEAERRLYRLQVLREIDRAIVQHLSLREVLQVVLKQIPRELGADAVAVSLLEPDGLKTSVFTMRLPNGTVVSEEAFKLAESLLHWLVVRQEPVIIHNLEEDPRVQGFRKKLRDDRLISYLGVPLVSRGRTLGILHILTTRPWVFPSEDVEFFQTLAGQAAIAIENARDFEEIQERAHRLHALSELSREINRPIEFKETIRVAVEYLNQVLPNTCFALIIHVLEGSKGEVVALNSAARILFGNLGIYEGSQIPLASSALSRAARTKHPVYFPDLRTIAFPLEHNLHQLGIGSLWIGPLVIDDVVFGSIITARKQTHGFSNSDRQFLEAVTRHLSVALHKHRILDQLKNAYEELRQTRQAIVEQERLHALGQMASGIAHDLNNAITPILGYAEMLLSDHKDLDPRQRRYIDSIRRAANDLRQIVERMRAFYRKREPRELLEPVQLNRLIEEAIELSRPRWKDMVQERGFVIQVKTELDPNLPRIMGSGSEIRQSILNLIFNAVDAMPQGGDLILRTRVVRTWQAPYEHGSWVVLEVEDTGIGMDEETRQRCLEPFFTTKGEGGTGLGLASVYGTMQRHSGHIQVESTPGQGTVFRLWFPARASADISTQVVKQPRAQVCQRILVVDDDPLVRELVREMLENLGHIVETADGGRQGIDILRGALSRGLPFSVVMTDLGMPEIDGRAVAREVKKLSPQTKVVLLTGWGARIQDEEEFLEAIDVVLGKPVTLQELQQTLAQLIG